MKIIVEKDNLQLTFQLWDNPKLAVEAEANMRVLYRIQKLAYASGYLGVSITFEAFKIVCDGVIVKDKLPNAGPVSHSLIWDTDNNRYAAVSSE